jgi:hypothetical protein
MPFTANVMYMYTAWIVFFFLQATCPRRNSDVRKPRFGHSWYTRNLITR